MSCGIAGTAEAREELAQGFEESLGVSTGEKQRLAQLVAATLRG